MPRNDGRTVRRSLGKKARRRRLRKDRLKAPSEAARARKHAREKARRRRRRIGRLEEQDAMLSSPAETNETLTNGSVSPN